MSQLHSPQPLSPRPPASDLVHPHFAADAHDDHGAFGPPRADLDLRYVVSAIRAHLWLIAAIIGAALLIALVLTLLQTPRYTAATTVQINDTSGRILNDQDSPGEEQVNSYYDTERFLKTQTDIIKSRGLALRVAQKLKLIGNQRFYAAQEAGAPPASAAAEVKRNQAIALLRGNLTVDLPRDSRIVTISVESTDPEFAAEIANAYASEFIQSNLQRKFDSSSYARGFLSDQLEAARLRLEESERALNAYARENGLIRTGGSPGGDQGSAAGGGSVTTSSLLEVNSAANAATARRIDAEGRWRAISAVPLLSTPQVVGNPTVSGLLAEKARLEADLAEEQARHLDDYPTVRSKKQQLATLNQQIQQAALP